MTEASDPQDKRLDDIRLILRDLLKVIKVVSMYPADNPLPQSLRRSFTEKLISIVDSYGDMRILVGKSRLSCHGSTVYEDKSKEEALAAIFFDTGITEFTFREGIDVDDIYKFLEVLREYLNAAGQAQDLAGLLWEAGIDRFGFETVEDIALSEYDGKMNANLMGGSGQDDELIPDGHGQFGYLVDDEYQALFTEGHESNEIELTDTPDRGTPIIGRGGSRTSLPGGPIELPAEADIFSRPGGDNDSLKTAEAAQAMGYGDLQATAPAMPDTSTILNDEFELSDQQEQEIKEILEEDADFEPFESTVEILKELLLQETEMSAFYETITICEKIQTELCKLGKIANAAQIMHYLKELQSQLKKKKPLWAERLKEAILTAGTRDRLKAFADGLNAHEEVSTREITEYLEPLGWEALGATTDLIADIRHDHHRETVCDHLTRKGSDRLEIISKGIYDRRPQIVCSTVMILARIGSDRSLEYLEKIVGHADDSVRRELVKNLVDCPHDRALELLKHSIGDREPDIRRQAIDSIVARRDQAALQTITGIINDYSFADLEHSDQQDLLNAFSKLGGEKTVSYFADLILKYNIFRSSNLAFYRTAAFEALALSRSEVAGDLINKLCSNWRPNIRAQAIEAQRRRREMIYGEES